MKFTLYWRDGKSQIVKGRNPADAMTQAGYGQGALGALDFYDRGNTKKYAWNAATREWESIKKVRP
jgi:hypothetical protein